jgi:hypothetical protein
MREEIMKAIKGVVAFGLCLVTVAIAGAQGGKCDASVTKREVKASTRMERGWEIQFDLTVNACAANGTFEYVVDLAEKGKVESQTVTADFATERAGTSTITIRYGAPAFKDLKDVKGAKVRTCTCS